MPDGGTLRVQVEDGSEKTVRITLSDTGVGFTEQQLEKVFEPFQPGFRGGTGLGLAIVYQIVQRLQGTIRVESKAGKGAKFMLELPKKPAPAGAAKVPSTPAVSSGR
jgi:two-component system sensor histidine kinase PilS (NtrC family)